MKDNDLNIERPTFGDMVYMKEFEESVSFFLEDFVEVGLQYFYFEKFSFLPNDILALFNAVFMVLKALDLVIRMIILIKQKWHYGGRIMGGF